MIHSVNDILQDIKLKAYDARLNMYIKQGVKEEIFGANLGDLRKIANKIKTNHKIALDLWETNIYEARVIACIIFDPKLLKEEDLYRLIRSTESGPVIDELSFNVFVSLNNQIELFNKWINSNEPRFKRAGWNMGIILNHDSKFNEIKLKEILSYIENNLQTDNEVYQIAMICCYHTIVVQYGLID